MRAPQSVTGERNTPCLIGIISLVDCGRCRPPARFNFGCVQGQPNSKSVPDAKSGFIGIINARDQSAMVSVVNDPIREILVFGPNDQYQSISIGIIAL